jgi:uncharacterized membrane protein
MCSDGKLRKIFTNASLDMLAYSTASFGYTMLLIAGMKCFQYKLNNRS